MAFGAGMIVVCDTPENTLAAFALATSYAGCPYELDSSDTSDTWDTSDTRDTSDTAAPPTDTADTAAAQEEDSSGGSDERGVCGLLKGLFDDPAYCRPWFVQANFPNRAHTLNIWFEDVPDRYDLRGAKTDEVVVAHCPDPNDGNTATATSLEGHVEIDQDRFNKARVRVDTPLASGALKFRVCR